MGKAHDIIRKHVGNPDGLLGILDDMLYAQVAHNLGNHLLESYAMEVAETKEIKDGKIKTYALIEAERLQILAHEMLAIAPPSREEVQKIIAARYMVNPNRET